MDNFGSNYHCDLEWTWIFDHFEMIGHEMPKRFAAAVNGCGFLLAQAWCCSEREKNCSSLPWQSSRSAKKRPGCMACEVSKKCCNIKKWLTYESKLLQSGWTLSSWEGLIRTAGVWGADTFGTHRDLWCAARKRFQPLLCRWVQSGKSACWIVQMTKQT